MNTGRALLMCIGVVVCQPTFADEPGNMRKHHRSYIPARYAAV